MNCTEQQQQIHDKRRKKKRYESAYMLLQNAIKRKKKQQKNMSESKCKPLCQDVLMHNIQCEYICRRRRLSVRRSV